MYVFDSFEAAVATTVSSEMCALTFVVAVCYRNPCDILHFGWSWCAVQNITPIAQDHLEFENDTFALSSKSIWLFHVKVAGTLL